VLLSAVIHPMRELAVLCSKCATKLPDGSEFCLKCGEPVSAAKKDVSPASAEGVLACSKCSTKLPDGAEFCPKCGKPVSLPARSGVRAATPPSEKATTPPQRRPRRKWRIVLGVLLVLILLAIVWAGTSESPTAQGIQDLVGWKHDQTILETPFVVGPHTFRYYKFSLPQGSVNVAIVGQFTASATGLRGASVSNDASVKDAGAGDGIEVYVLTETAFTVWQNGYATSSVYDSGPISQGTLREELPAGAGIYYLIFSNKFSPKTPKSVHATVLLRYKSWLPESIHRGMDRFWNWLGV